MDEVFTTVIICSVYLQLCSPRLTTKTAKTLGNEVPERSYASTAATYRRRETAQTHTTGPSEHELTGLLLHSMGLQFECMCKLEIKTHILHQSHLLNVLNKKIHGKIHFDTQSFVLYIGLEF